MSFFHENVQSFKRTKARNTTAFILLFQGSWFVRLDRVRVFWQMLFAIELKLAKQTSFPHACCSIDPLFCQQINNRLSLSLPTPSSVSLSLALSLPLYLSYSLSHSLSLSLILSLSYSLYLACSLALSLTLFLCLSRSLTLSFSHTHIPTHTFKSLCNRVLSGLLMD
jgi:hypothetical protein